jgi:hypothetical protein
MTKDELTNYYLGLSRAYLNANTVYLNNWKAFDTSSMYAQQPKLMTINIYLKALRFCIDNFDSLVEDFSDEKILATINEAAKVLKTFKPYYNEG